MLPHSLPIHSPELFQVPVPPFLDEDSTETGPTDVWKAGTHLLHLSNAEALLKKLFLIHSKSSNEDT